MTRITIEWEGRTYTIDCLSAELTFEVQKPTIEDLMARPSRSYGKNFRLTGIVDTISPSPLQVSWYTELYPVLINGEPITHDQPPVTLPAPSA